MSEFENKHFFFPKNCIYDSHPHKHLCLNTGALGHRSCTLAPTFSKLGGMTPHLKVFFARCHVYICSPNHEFLAQRLLARHCIFCGRLHRKSRRERVRGTARIAHPTAPRPALDSPRPSAGPPAVPFGPSPGRVSAARECRARRSSGCPPPASWGCRRSAASSGPGPGGPLGIASTRVSRGGGRGKENTSKGKVLSFTPGSHQLDVPIHCMGFLRGLPFLPP